ncbi:hypothetical protein GZH53_00660 [Flavihumibacter sp. R14]|nr:hypothetical protein [Flavihumibacter soli]
MHIENWLKRFLNRIFQKPLHEDNIEIITNWRKKGKPVPPPHLIKQEAINNIKKVTNYNLFIETGTYLGEMVESQLENFRTIYSIELGELLFRNAQAKFEKYPHVEILHGDSGEVLIELCDSLNEPAIYWLDGHYSEGITAKGNKDCPIFEELSAIFNAKFFEHVILIDDARLFIGKDDYPTLTELTTYISENRPSSEILIQDDIIKVFIR